MDFEFLHRKYDPTKYSQLLRDMLGETYQTNLVPLPFQVEHTRVEFFAQTGSIVWNETGNVQTTINVYEIKLKPGVTKIHLNRVALNTFVEQIRGDAAVAGALAVFVEENSDQWRLSFVAKRNTYDVQGNEINISTTPKRFTYLFGPNESIHTAKKRFEYLAKIPSKRLEDFVEAFSVEKISDSFFKEYKNLYQIFCEDIYQSALAQQIFGDDEIGQKHQRDFIKRMLGRVTFLYFIQKKGWLGVKYQEKGFKNGDTKFMPHLFEKTMDKGRFYSQVLRPLFFDTLNNDHRPDDTFTLPDGSVVKVPFLNGGLFEHDFPGSENLDFPAEHFKTLFDTFDQYNFTIDESSPNEHEVGIDPEMLGHIFENLLEDNKDKGTFYTPKTVVHYMCQESLIQYLASHLNPTNKELEDIEQFIRTKTNSDYIKRNKDGIIRLLRNVKICDPAIGSGAFPMGMLHEILYCLLELESSASPYALKQHIIQNAIHGVDFEKGAVDIARLRFWLSLVVDAELVNEEKPAPLPNLDYKIMQGDSLLERFKDIPLDRIARDFAIKIFEPGDLSALNEPEPTYGGLQYKTDTQQSNLKTKIKRFFQPMPFEEKEQLQKEIDEEVHEIIQFNFELKEKELRDELNNHQKLLAGIPDKIYNPPARGIEKRNNEARQNLQRKIQIAERKLAELAAKKAELESLMAKPDQKNYFLWHAYFQEVMEQGGFDIIIANPPYIQLQRLGAKTDDYEAAGFDTFSRSGDIYCLFYEQGFRLLREGGILTYITSNKWMRADYGRPTRQYLSERVNLLRLVDFGSVQVFRTATVDTNILIARKEPPPPECTVKSCRFTFGYVFGAPLDTYIKDNEVMLNALGEDGWVVADRETFAIKRLIEHAGIPLKDWKIITTDVKGKAVEKNAIQINYGIKTGYNKAFIIPEAQKDALLKQVRTQGGPLEQYDALFKRILEGKDIKKFRATWDSLWIIFTKRGIDIGQYPIVEEFLRQYYLDLKPKITSNEPRGRKPGPYKWYEIQDPVAYYRDFEKPKIIWGNLNVNATFTVDTEGMYLNAPANLLTSSYDNIKYLGAVLNSRVTSFMMRQIAYTREHGYVEYKKVFVEQLPVPKIPEEKQRPFGILVDYLLFLYDPSKPKVHPHASNETLAASFENYMNMAVYELYFEEHMKEKGIDVLQFFNLPDLGNFSDDASKVEEIRRQYDLLEAYEHPVRNRIILANLHSKDIIGKINSQTL